MIILNIFFVRVLHGRFSSLVPINIIVEYNSLLKLVLLLTINRSLNLNINQFWVYRIDFHYELLYIGKSMGSLIVVTYVVRLCVVRLFIMHYITGMDYIIVDINQIDLYARHWNCGYNPESFNSPACMEMSNTALHAW